MKAKKEPKKDIELEIRVLHEMRHLFEENVKRARRAMFLCPLVPEVLIEHKDISDYKVDHLIDDIRERLWKNASNVDPNLEGRHREWWDQKEIEERRNTLNKAIREAEAEKDVLLDQ